MRAMITAVGHYVPEEKLTNNDLERMVDTNDEWITTRTGIKERRILATGKGTSFMAVQAIQMILKQRQLSADEIDLIIVATVTPDKTVPPTAALVQKELKAHNCWGYDLNGACSGFLFALASGMQFIESGRHNKVIVVGADKMSAITNYQDRNTCILFGDAAGAVLLEPTTEDDQGIKDFFLKLDGTGADYLHIAAGGSLIPTTPETVANKLHYLYQDGKAVFKHAVSGMTDVITRIINKHQLRPDDISLLIPHQANLRIIDATGRRMGLPPEKVMVNIENYGNTTAATIPLCLWEYEKKLKKGDVLILAAFGGGFTWGSMYLKWAYDPQ